MESNKSGSISLVNRFRIATKLRVLLTVLILIIIITNGINFLNTNNIFNGLKAQLYDELFIGEGLLLNADRDFYQAKVAVFKAMKMENSQEAEKLLADYKENLQQTKDRVMSVEEIFNNNKDAYQSLQSDDGNTVFDHCRTDQSAGTECSH
ncbi:chemoreceptor-like protein with four helix bundle sensory module [Melghiribacillus thermohalophilus]|uniref:Chemoreceptor-like protein with four helix bundle sensory module n=1 Tax=Melghiribacillus thermohalophilus TaxID=1324956 RepID=A0A4V2V1M6_9BACI|nr:MCP four helix bundle domain-containing protein [Melghiribacillus thermohalophilus]TCT21702.1 chemoreceptor-like protein with four helix bundle sensory module [Melghiribacillus thermohalophilus]